MADKLAIRKYVPQKTNDPNLLNHLYGVYNSPNEMHLGELISECIYNLSIVNLAMKLHQFRFLFGGGKYDWIFVRMGRAVPRKHPYEHLALEQFSQFRNAVFESKCGGIQSYLNWVAVPGANIPFFVNLGIDYYAVEGSESIVTRLHSKFPQLKDNIICGDFTQTLPEMEFHLIVDRASLTCNDISAIERCLRMCHNAVEERRDVYRN